MTSLGTAFKCISLWIIEQARQTDSHQHKRECVCLSVYILSGRGVGGAFSVQMSLFVRCTAQSVHQYASKIVLWVRTELVQATGLKVTRNVPRNCAHTHVTETVRIYTSQKLCAYTPHRNCAHTHLTETVHINTSQKLCIHTSQKLCTYIRHRNCALTHVTETVHIHTSQKLCTYTPHRNCAHTHLTETVHIHTSQEPHIHTSQKLYTYTRHRNCAHTHLTETVHIQTSQKLCICTPHNRIRVKQPLCRLTYLTTS